MEADGVSVRIVCKAVRQKSFKWEYNYPVTLLETWDENWNMCARINWFTRLRLPITVYYYHYHLHIYCTQTIFGILKMSSCNNLLFHLVNAEHTHTHVHFGVYVPPHFSLKLVFGFVFFFLLFSLRENSIGVEGAKNMAQALHENRSLQFLEWVTSQSIKSQ